MSAIEQLAGRLKEMARDEARSTTPHPERFKVTDASPLTLDQLHGSIVLVEDDDDFELSQWVRQYDDKYGIEVDDVVVCFLDNDVWIAKDVISDTAVESW